MTICIAAICESGKYVVAVADRMITYPPPVNIEFESVESKIEGMTSTCLFMASGNVSFASDISAEVRVALGGNQTPQIDSVAKSFKDKYWSVRAQKIYDTVIAGTFGKDFEDFKTRGGTLPQYLQTQAATYGQIVLASNNFNMNLEFIVCGIDSKGSHVFNIYHPGTSTSLDKLGYSAIRSGANHALIRLSLLGQNTKLDLKSTVVNVCEAKRISELAPGVGRRTSIAVIDGSKGKTFFLSDALLDEITKAQQEAQQTIEASFHITENVEGRLKTEIEATKDTP
jgi:hypothetical protein